MEKYKALFDKLKEEEVYYEDYVPMITGKANKVLLIFILMYVLGVIVFRSYISKKIISASIAAIMIMVLIIKRVVCREMIPKKLMKLMNSNSKEFEKVIIDLKKERKTRAKNLCMERYILGTVRLEEVVSWLNIDKSNIKYSPDELKPRRIEIDSEKAWFEFLYESNEDGAMLSFECLSTQVDDTLICGIADVNTVLIELIEDGDIIDTLIDNIDERYEDGYEGEVQVRGNNCVAKVTENVIYNGDNKINYKIEISYS